MLARTTFCFWAIIFVCLHSPAQSPPPRALPAKKTSQKVKIDGLLNEAAWKDAALMDNLVDFRRNVGAREPYANRTEAYLMYDELGIYFGGYCHETSRDSIATELKGRDGFGTNDYIGIIFDTYYDKINGFEYFVTPLNEQWDAKAGPSNGNGGEDFSWSAVWNSAAVIQDSGWSFEMFIPYSAIRFGKKQVQDWGLNITRRRRKTEQQYIWNPVDPNVNGFLTQEGVWKGLTDIKPPLRLQFSPYFSIYANHYPALTKGQKSWTSQVNGGMDLKYGINQAFTLDATLIPDFGQVQSDNQVLNLTPFEVKFNENRNFFTEGTELFSKGNLFYSRRIGGTPLHLYDAYDKIQPNEAMLKNPAESKLINASKISGRTQHGLGIGVLNAITRSQFATIENLDTHEKYKYETDPLTNYNILVLDQTLKHNSSLSLVNSSVIRSGKDYDANVTAALFDLNDKTNTWNIGGKLAYSALIGYGNDGKNVNGLSSRVHLGKTSGRFTFSAWEELADTKYSHNDLGYFTNNNYLDHGAYAGYRWIEPRGWYNRIFINFNTYVSFLHTRIDPIQKKFQKANFNFNINIQSKKLFWLYFFSNYSPRQNDFYEPRQQGYFFERGASITTGVGFEGNSAKRYSFFTELEARHYFNYYHMLGIGVSFNQVFRINEKLSLSEQTNWTPNFNGVGYAATSHDTIIFGRRMERTIENILGLKYNFNNRMGITFRARHYLSSVENKEFFELQRATGKLASNPALRPDADQNVNYFNIDMVYTWQFAPGSFLNLVWKDASYTYHNEVERNYFKNFGRTVDEDQNNNFSVKVIYFIDYLQLKRKKH